MQTLVREFFDAPEEVWTQDYYQRPANKMKYAKNTGERFQIDTRNVIRQYRSALGTFVQVCKAWEIEPVLMTQVILDQDDVTIMNEIPDIMHMIMPEDPMKDPEMLSVMYSFQNAFNKVIREVAAAEDILLVDLKKLVPTNNHRYLYDRFHYNDSGSVLVSSFIANKLQGIIEGHSSADPGILETEKQPQTP